MMALILRSFQLTDFSLICYAPKTSNFEDGYFILNLSRNGFLIKEYGRLFRSLEKVTTQDLEKSLNYGVDLKGG